jgi:hypothetical protein
MNGPTPPMRARRPATAEADANFTDEELKAMQQEYEKERKLHEAYRLDLWARERRDFWKGIVTMSVAGVAIKGEMATEEVRACANLALRWFDETFGGDFPIDLKVYPGGR